MKGRGLIRVQLLKAVGERLAPHGFVLSVRDGAFDRNEEDLRSTLHLPFIARPRCDLEMTASASIRFHSLENLIDRLSPADPLMPERDRLRRATLGVDLGRHARGLWQKNWKLKDKSQVPETAAKIADYLLKKGLPFFEEYSDKSRALAVLCRDDETARDLMPFHEHRAKSAIGLAFLLDGPDRAREVAKAKLAWLQTRPYAVDREGVARWAEKLLGESVNSILPP